MVNNNVMYIFPEIKVTRGIVLIWTSLRLRPISESRGFLISPARV